MALASHFFVILRYELLTIDNSYARLASYDRTLPFPYYSPNSADIPFRERLVPPHGRKCGACRLLDRRCLTCSFHVFPLLAGYPLSTHDPVICRHDKRGVIHKGTSGARSTAPLGDFLVCRVWAVIFRPQR